MTDTAVEKVSLPLDSVFKPYLVNALQRFTYLWPEAQVEIQEGHVTILLHRDMEDFALVVQDFQFCLYREKIYRETLPLRETLIIGLMGR